jgi:hypothetical protein
MAEKSPRDMDILFGRGPDCWNHNGNKQFRIIITTFQHVYHSISKRAEKVELVSKIVDDIRASGVKFLKRSGSTNEWKEVGRKACIAKVSSIASLIVTDPYHILKLVSNKSTSEFQTGWPCYQGQAKQQV